MKKYYFLLLTLLLSGCSIHAGKLETVPYEYQKDAMNLVDGDYREDAYIKIALDTINLYYNEAYTKEIPDMDIKVSWIQYAMAGSDSSKLPEKNLISVFLISQLNNDIIYGVTIDSDTLEVDHIQKSFNLDKLQLIENDSEAISGNAIDWLNKMRPDLKNPVVTNVFVSFEHEVTELDCEGTSVVLIFQSSDKSLCSFSTGNFALGFASEYYHR